MALISRGSSASDSASIKSLLLKQPESVPAASFTARVGLRWVFPLSSVVNEVAGTSTRLQCRSSWPCRCPHRTAPRPAWGEPRSWASCPPPQAWPPLSPHSQPLVHTPLCVSPAWHVHLIKAPPCQELVWESCPLKSPPCCTGHHPASVGPGRVSASLCTCVLLLALLRWSAHLSSLCPPFYPQDWISS